MLKQSICFCKIILFANALFVLLGTVAQANEANNVNPFFGSFSTNIPFEVPANHGLEPNIGLTYNSTTKNGVVGVGWTLGGVSYIERGLPGGGSPKYDANDGYFLDGTELVPCAAQGGSHCTKIQSFSRIIKEANNTWTVIGTNGNKMTYEPKFETSRGIYRWYLTQVEDTHGNFTTYSYWADGNPILEVYLDTISYNGAVIDFYYEGRNDIITFATGAVFGKITSRLKSIVSLLII